ncbi:hypothetical protein C8J57DRAFT_1246286 [Mycena rebaudengoi]|nr:hypothetical protein C8J57DRAFT_1246286 [Mycena rebaudengoi]
MNEADRTGERRGFGLGHIKDISCGQVGTYSACGVYGSIRRNPGSVERARSAEVMDNERATAGDVRNRQVAVDEGRASGGLGLGHILWIGGRSIRSAMRIAGDRRAKQCTVESKRMAPHQEKRAFISSARYQNREVGSTKKTHQERNRKRYGHDAEDAKRSMSTEIFGGGFEEVGGTTGSHYPALANVEEKNLKVEGWILLRACWLRCRRGELLTTRADIDQREREERERETEGRWREAEDGGRCMGGTGSRRWWGKGKSDESPININHFVTHMSSTQSITHVGSEFEMDLEHFILSQTECFFPDAGVPEAQNKRRFSASTADSASLIFFVSLRLAPTASLVMLALRLGDESVSNPQTVAFTPTAFFSACTLRHAQQRRYLLSESAPTSSCSATEPLRNRIPPALAHNHSQRLFDGAWFLIGTDHCGALRCSISARSCRNLRCTLVPGPGEAPPDPRPLQWHHQHLPIRTVPSPLSPASMFSWHVFAPHPAAVAPLRQRRTLALRGLY